MSEQEFPGAMSELEAMNLLQDFGVISDNCIDWVDVGNKETALEWLAAHQDVRDLERNEEQ